MKFLSLLLLLALAACSKAPVETKEVTVGISGMTCEGCTQTISNALVKLPGVEACQVSLANSNAVVVIDPSVIEPAMLAKRVEQLGYKTN